MFFLNFLLLLTFPWGAWTNLSDGTRSTGSSLGFFLGPAGPQRPSESSAPERQHCTAVWEQKKKREKERRTFAHRRALPVRALKSLPCPHLIPHLYPSRGSMVCRTLQRVGVGLTVLTFNSLRFRTHSRPKVVLVT